MNAAELKACPFCGARPEVIERREQQYNWGLRRWEWVTKARIKCDTCGVEQGRSAESVEEAVEAWNQRAGEKIGDAEPARWLHRKRNGYAVLVCSACEALKEGYTRTAYCPHCGRPMTGGEAQG